MVGQDTLRTLSQLKRPKCFLRKDSFIISIFTKVNFFFQIEPTLVSIAFVPENQHNFRTLFMSFSEKS